MDNKGDEKALVSSDELSKMRHGNTVWNAKVNAVNNFSRLLQVQLCKNLIVLFRC